jgi:hypothetical protein
MTSARLVSPAAIVAIGGGDRCEVGGFGGGYAMAWWRA